MSESDNSIPGDTVDARPGLDRNILRRSLFAATALVAVAATAAGAYFGTKYTHLHERDEARESARQAACAYGPVLANYDAKSLDTYFSAVLARATGDWHQEFDSTSKDLREVLTQGQVVSKADSVSCAVESGDDTTARALLIIDQSISSVGTQGQPRSGRLAITLSLRKLGDRWLVNKVDSPAIQR